MQRLVFVLLLFFAQAAVADQLYVFVHVKCTPEHIEVSFERGWNEIGESMLAAPLQNRWNTDELRTVTSQDDINYKTTPLQKYVTCQLAGRKMRILVEPEFAPHWHPVGHCATRTGAKVKIYRGSSLVVSEGLDACTESGNVPVSIEVLANGAPKVSRVSALEFLYGI